VNVRSEGREKLESKLLKKIKIGTLGRVGGGKRKEEGWWGDFKERK